MPKGAPTSTAGYAADVNWSETLQRKEKGGLRGVRAIAWKAGGSGETRNPKRASSLVGYVCPGAGGGSSTPQKGDGKRARGLVSEECVWHLIARGGRGGRGSDSNSRTLADERKDVPRTNKKKGEPGTAKQVLST